MSDYVQDYSDSPDYYKAEEPLPPVEEPVATTTVVTENPESTWGKPPAVKATWVEEYAPPPPPPPTSAEVDATNPESTWGKPTEDKVAWNQENVEDYDPATYTGAPTATAPSAEAPSTSQSPPEQVPVSDSPDYVADDRPPEEVPAPFMPAENSGVDYTPLPGDPAPPPAPAQETSPPPIEPPVGFLSGSVDVTGVTDDMTVEKFDAQA